MCALPLIGPIFLHVTDKVAVSYSAGFTYLNDSLFFVQDGFHFLHDQVKIEVSWALDSCIRTLLSKSLSGCEE